MKGFEYEKNDTLNDIFDCPSKPFNEMDQRNQAQNQNFNKQSSQENRIDADFENHQDSRRPSSNSPAYNCYLLVCFCS